MREFKNQIPIKPVSKHRHQILMTTSTNRSQNMKAKIEFRDCSDKAESVFGAAEGYFGEIEAVPAPAWPIESFSLMDIHGNIVALRS